VAVVNAQIYPPNQNSIAMNETIDMSEVGTPFGLALVTKRPELVINS